MSRLAPAVFLVLLGLTAAVGASCATSSPIQDGAGGSTAPLGGTTGAGMRSCGIQSSVMPCQSCINARCCAEGQACAADPTCIACIDQGSSSDACNNDRPLGTFMQCLRD